MSQSEEKKQAERPVTPPAEKAEEKQEEAQDQGLKYRFKIAPADPKNSFDFEDVADK